MPGLVFRIRRDDGDLPAGPAELIIRSGRQPEQAVRLADFDGPFRNDSSLSSSPAIQSLCSCRMLNSMAVRQFAVPFDFARTGSLGIRFQKGLSLGAGRFARKGKCLPHEAARYAPGAIRSVGRGVRGL